MIELDPPLRALRDQCRDAATDLRSRALSVDVDPEDMTGHLDSPALAMVRAASTPKRFQDPSGWQGEYTDSCLSRAVASLELACGDAGLLTANTGPALAGIAVDALGSEAQQEFFYESIADGRTWTFFAMTEDARGSDATAMETRLDADPDGDYRLFGAKRYVGNGSRGATGVVFARTGRSPLSIRAAILSCPTPGFAGHALEMTGLRGARISELSFDGVHVPREMLLGAHLPASRRGIWGASRTFNVMRIQIAAMALGVAFAARDYVCEQRPGWSGHELTTARLAASRALLYDAANEVDLSPDDRRTPSIAKLHATDLAVHVTGWAANALGPGSLLLHPLLEKWCRDVRAFEFMDGTSNILRLHITHGIATRRPTS
jgi:alkylation response protein AidB-like acyl-CoA dehydrogenase